MQLLLESTKARLCEYWTNPTEIEKQKEANKFRFDSLQYINTKNCNKIFFKFYSNLLLGHGLLHLLYLLVLLQDPEKFKNYLQIVLGSIFAVIQLFAKNLQKNLFEFIIIDFYSMML